MVAIVNDAIILDSEPRARMLPMMSEAEEIADLKERERRLAKIQCQALDDMVNEELIAQGRGRRSTSTRTGVQAAPDETGEPTSLRRRPAKVLAQQGPTMVAN